MPTSEKMRTVNVAPRVISDDFAEKEIVTHLQQLKTKNLHTTNILELSNSLRFPIAQIDRILDTLEKKSLVRDIE